jgi:hypothetical protein
MAPRLLVRIAAGRYIGASIHCACDFYDSIDRKARLDRHAGVAEVKAALLLNGHRRNEGSMNRELGQSFQGQPRPRHYEYRTAAGYKPG